MRELTKEERQKWIVNRQGKDMILSSGLVHLAHEAGLVEIKTKLLQYPSQENGGTCYFRAKVTLHDGDDGRCTFTGHADANAGNVGAMVKLHLPRMAETRAINRALRFALDVGYVSAEEVGEEDDTPIEQRQQQHTPRQQQESPPREQPAPKPATSEQYAQLDAAAAKLLNDFGKDESGRIVDGLSMAQADILLSKLNVTYTKCAGDALPPVETAAKPKSIAEHRAELAADKATPARVKTLNGLQAKLGLPVTTGEDSTAAAVDAAIAECVTALNKQTGKVAAR